MRLLQFLRSLVVLIATPLLTLAISVAAVLCIFCCRMKAERIQVLARRWGRSICGLAGVRVTVEGREHLAHSGPYIFAANHQSQFDIFALQGYLGVDFRWMAKKELFKIPIFGAGMRSAGYIGVDRSRGRQAVQSLNEAAKRISDGTSVIIFPEGTRSRDGRLQEFKTGAVVLAIKAGVPIVPVGIIGTHQILPKGKLLARPGTILIKIGRPIDTTQFGSGDKQALASRLHQEVVELIAETEGMPRQ